MTTTTTTSISTTSPDGRLLSIREAAEVMAVCQETVRRHVRRGVVPAIRIGAVYRIRLADVEAALRVRVPDADGGAGGE